MVAFVFSIIIALIALAAFGIAAGFSSAIRKGSPGELTDSENRTGRTISAVVGVLALLGAGLLMFFGSILVGNGVGEAKVYTNPDGTIAFVQDSPGFIQKAPWQNYVDFDLFSQTATFAGSDGNAPSYSGGTVSGREITAAVARGAQSNFDLVVTYSLDANAVKDIYTQFKSQENFTQQIITQQIVSVTRKIPSNYTPVEFRGEKAGEAQQKMYEALNSALGEWGVKVNVVNLNNIRYSEQVEASITAVEQAQQKEEQAQADLRAAEVSAQTRVVEATAQAEANNILNASLTPQLLQQQYIAQLGAGTVYVVPDGATPFIGAK